MIFKSLLAFFHFKWLAPPSLLSEAKALPLIVLLTGAFLLTYVGLEVGFVTLTAGVKDRSVIRKKVEVYRSNGHDTISCLIWQYHLLYMYDILKYHLIYHMTYDIYCDLHYNLHQMQCSGHFFQVAFGGYVDPFAVKELQLSKVERNSCWVHRSDGFFLSSLIDCWLDREKVIEKQSNITNLIVCELIGSNWYYQARLTSNQYGTNFILVVIGDILSAKLTYSTGKPKTWSWQEHHLQTVTFQGRHCVYRVWHVLLGFLCTFVCRSLG